MALHQRSQAQVLRAAILLALAGVILCHGGHLHDYPEEDPVSNNWKRTLVGSCSNWKKPSLKPVTANTTTKPVATKLTTGRRLQAGMDHSMHGGMAMNSTSNATSKATSKGITVEPSTLSVKGTAQLWVYLEENCSNSVQSGVKLDVTIASDGEPASKVAVDGYVMTGTCANGGGSKYLFDIKAEADDENMLFLADKLTTSTGIIKGISPSDGELSTAGTTGAKSLVLLHNDTAFSCCDFIIEEPTADHAAPLVKAGNDCSLNSTNDDTQLGMIMNGVWAPCTMKVDGEYVMDHGNGDVARCTELRNGTRVSPTKSSSGTTTGSDNSTAKNTTGHQHNSAASRVHNLWCFAAAVLVALGAVLCF